ncbi:MAG: hypothetical protein AAB397_03880 [Patescibacteria group bacterium]
MLKSIFFKYFLSDNRREKGAVGLLLSFIILSIIFIISVGMATVRLVEIQLAYDVFESVVAYQAADSGIEYALNELQIDLTGSAIGAIVGVFCDNYDKVAVGDGFYCLDLTYAGLDVASVKSIGMFKDTRRAVEINL